MTDRRGRFGTPLIRLGETGSTNDVGRLLAAAGLPEGAVVVAERQTHGRGRWGRVWASPAGGLWCSVVLRPAGRAAWGLLSLAVGVAAAEAVEELAGVAVGLRWPNDLIVVGRKAGGILLEGAPGAVIAGIGINVAVPPEALPPEIAAGAISLHVSGGRSLTPARLLTGLLARLERWYGCWIEGGPTVVEAWAERDLLRERWVTFGGPHDPVEGLAEGVDPDGALRVRTSGGEIRRVLAGDLVPGGGSPGPAEDDVPAARRGS